MTLVEVGISAAASVDVWLDEADERALRLADASTADDRVDAARAVPKEPLV